jgi:hypothetical protein
MNPKERRTLKMKSNKYVLIIDILFRRNYDGILLRCVDERKAQELMKEFHEGICGGHFAPTSMAHKIIRVGFYWPSAFKDSYASIRKCVSCQHFLAFPDTHLQCCYMPNNCYEQPFSQKDSIINGKIEELLIKSSFEKELNLSLSLRDYLFEVISPAGRNSPVNLWQHSEE